MSLTQRVKQGFLRLPLMKKAILTGSAALVVSTVLPWYDLRNSFGVGATYLGIQGPLFVIGLLVLGCGLVSFFNMFFPLMGRQFFNLRKMIHSRQDIFHHRAFYACQDLPDLGNAEKKYFEVDQVARITNTVAQAA